jgi:hypothetical protein
LAVCPLWPPVLASAAPVLVWAPPGQAARRPGVAVRWAPPGQAARWPGWQGAGHRWQAVSREAWRSAEDGTWPARTPPAGDREPEGAAAAHSPAVGGPPAAAAARPAAMEKGASGGGSPSMLGRRQGGEWMAGAAEARRPAARQSSVGDGSTRVREGAEKSRM